MIPKAYKKRVCEYCGYQDVSVYLIDGHEICAECWKKQHGKAISEDHHIYGKSRNDTALIPANLHAYITQAKISWPLILKKFSDDPLLQIAYMLRNVQDPVIWCHNHPEILAIKSDRERIFQMVKAITSNLDDYSDWLIALQAFLVKQNGKDYFQTMGIAPLIIKSLNKDG
jgi:hypothetical protein